MTPNQLALKLKALAPDAEVKVRDLTGTQDHYEALIVSQCFEQQPTLERHRTVLQLVQPDLHSGEIHALTLKTYTPQQLLQSPQLRVGFED